MSQQQSCNIGIVFVLLVLCIAVFFLIQRYRSLESRYEQVHIQLQNTVSQDFLKTSMARMSKPAPATEAFDPNAFSCVDVGQCAEGMASAVFLTRVMTDGHEASCHEASCHNESCDEESHIPWEPRVVDVTDEPTEPVDEPWVDLQAAAQAEMQTSMFTDEPLDLQTREATTTDVATAEVMAAEMAVEMALIEQQAEEAERQADEAERQAEEAERQAEAAVTPEPTMEWEPTQSEPTQSEPTQSEPTMESEPTQSEPTQSEPTQSEPTQSEPTQSESTMESATDTSHPLDRLDSSPLEQVPRSGETRARRSSRR
jgi:hypothetical protein